LVCTIGDIIAHARNVAKSIKNITIGMGVFAPNANSNVMRSIIGMAVCVKGVVKLEIKCMI